VIDFECKEDTRLWNDLELTMDLHAVTLVVTAMLKVAADEFATFPLGSILNADCWLAKLPAPALDKYGFRDEGVDPSASLADLAASIAKLGFRTTCFECTSPGLRNFTTAGSEDIDAVTNRVLDYALDVIGGPYAQVQIDRALNNAARRCPHSAEYDPTFTATEYAAFEHDYNSSSTSFLLMILMVIGILLVGLIALVWARRCFVRARHRRLLKSLPDRQLCLLQKQQERGKKREKEENAVSRSLFQSSASIPAYVRFLMPLVIVGNMGLFLSGHLSLGATVNIYLQLAGQSISIEQVFSFSIAQSTIDIWNAGGQALACFILIFSGIWPYTKQIISLVLWFAPPSRVSIATRGSILLWLDSLAKWSMVDIFVLLVSLAGFRYVLGLLCQITAEADQISNYLFSILFELIPIPGSLLQALMLIFCRTTSIQWI
jgi:Paraquat-inducible protein A